MPTKMATPEAQAHTTAVELLITAAWIRLVLGLEVVVPGANHRAMTTSFVQLRAAVGIFPSRLGHLATWGVQ